jgi:hypothetical protein
MSRVGVISWDWREQPDPRELKALIEALTDGAVTLAVPNTGSDQYALVLSRGPITEAEATEAFDWYWRSEDPTGDRIDTFDWPPAGSAG